MILVNKPEKKSQESGSPEFQELKGICMALSMSKPPANITMFQFFSGIEKKVSWSGDTDEWCDKKLNSISLGSTCISSYQFLTKSNQNTF